MDASSRLLQSFKASGCSLQSLADRCGMEMPWMRDLMDYPDELQSNISLRDLKKVSAALNVSPAWLTAGVDERPDKHSDAWLHAQISQHLDNNGVTLAALEESVGYDIKRSDGKWVPVEEYNLECLLKLAAIMHLDWRNFV